MNPIQKAALVCCSNGIEPDTQSETQKLCAALNGCGIEVCESPYLYAKDTVFSACAKDRAAVLNRFMQDKSVDAVFDISGGDLANEVLPYLDYPAFAESHALFWGYSDLTTILNAVYAKTGKPSVLYSVRNLIRSSREAQLCDFMQFNSSASRALFQFPYRFLRGSEMSGTVIGGNVRCLLKLAGTPYFPDVTGKLLLLESLGGDSAKLAAYFSQLAQMGVFDRISGIILGTFTQMERSGCIPDAQTLVLNAASDSLPVICTGRIGHGADSKAVLIGGEYHFTA